MGADQSDWDKFDRERGTFCPAHAPTPDVEAIRNYWQQPTGIDKAPPGMVELAQRNILALCDRIKELEAEVGDKEDSIVRRLQQQLDNQARSLREMHRAIAKRKAENAQLRAERDQALVQIAEFRRKCDPKEQHVLVTAVEMSAPLPTPDRPDTEEKP